MINGAFESYSPRSMRIRRLQPPPCPGRRMNGEPKAPGLRQGCGSLSKRPPTLRGRCRSRSEASSVRHVGGDRLDHAKWPDKLPQAADLRADSTNQAKETCGESQQNIQVGKTLPKSRGPKRVPAQAWGKLMDARAAAGPRPRSMRGSWASPVVGAKSSSWSPAGAPAWGDAISKLGSTSDTPWEANYAPEAVENPAHVR